jgi:hypothetical protein
MKVRKYKHFYKSVADIANDLFTIGNDEPVQEITLATSTTVTTISNDLVGARSVILLSPRTAAAGSEDWWISSQDSRTFDITHSSGTSTRTYGVHVYG